MRNIQIDTLRGIACILLVAYHVIGNTPESGLKISSGIYRDINDLLAYVRMPLFTFLSGIVYSYRPFTTGALHFISSKARRLLLPMLCVGTLFAVMQSSVPGANGTITNWTMIHIYPVAHFWFVEAIFLIFLIVVLLEKLKAIENPIGFSIVFFAAVLTYLSNFGTPIFSISGAIYLFPFFLGGMFFQRYRYIETLSVTVGLLMLSVAIFTLILIFFDLLPPGKNRSFISLIIGLLFCIALLSLNFRVSKLAIIGSYSYSIFIYHVFFTASSRIALTKLGVFETNMLFIVCLFLGVFGPILTEQLLRGTNITRLLFLGMRASSVDNLWLTKRLTRTR